MMECYQCEEKVEYLFEDSRCIDCTHVARDEVIDDETICWRCGYERYRCICDTL